jgi:ribonuclease HII
VILAHPIPGLNDSKKLTAKKREQLVHIIQQEAIAYSYGEASIEEIDALNIHHATLLAMKKAVDGIQHIGSEVWIDGCFAPKTILPCKTFIKGDSLHACISAASILAKVARDQYIEDLCSEHPDLIEKYSLDTNKGYGSKKHIDGIKEHGITVWHRRSFGICSSF